VTSGNATVDPFVNSAHGSSGLSDPQGKYAHVKRSSHSLGLRYQQSSRIKELSKIHRERALLSFDSSARVLLDINNCLCRLLAILSCL
jgi:hypothetical protein